MVFPLKKTLHAVTEPSAEGGVLEQAADMDPAVMHDERRVLRRERRRLAVSLIAGLWKDHEGGPIDGVEYQAGMRTAWQRDT